MSQYAKPNGVTAGRYHQLRDNWRPELGPLKALCGLAPIHGWGEAVEERPERLCNNCIAVAGDYYGNRFDDDPVW